MLRLATNNNDEARDLIFKSILATHPNAIVHLGDIVSVGFNESSWRAFDEFMEAAGRVRIPIYPTLGNHEYMLLASQGVETFLERFPWHSKTGYSVRIGRVAIVLLNSNLSHLSDTERQSQVAWTQRTLEQLESDTTVSAVIVACHHSPFTNSTIVSPAEDVQKSFVPLFLRFNKCRLFLSGHCHAFEHFKYKGRDFLVIGGGGGLQQPLLTNGERRWEDLCPLTTETRMFHYLKCKIAEQSLELTVTMLRSDFSAFDEVYRVSIPYSRTAQGPGPSDGR